MPAEDETQIRRLSSDRLLAAGAIVLMAAAVVAAVVLFRAERAAEQDRAETELAAIAELKVSNLAKWREDRLDEVGLFAGNEAFAETVATALMRPVGAETDPALQDWLSGLKENHNYDSVYVLDAEGAVRASAGTPSSASIAHVTETLRGDTAAAHLTNIHLDEEGKPHLAVVAPIGTGDRQSVPVATLVATIDPQEFLFPYIQRWPVPSNTGETLIIRREGDDALFLNDLRFRENAAMQLRVPLSTARLPAAMAALGEEGFVEGVDYRGVPVLAYVQRVPDSPWFLVAKMDTSEALAAVRPRLVALASFAGATILMVGLIAMLVWRNRRAVFYQERYEHERERSRLRDIIDRSSMEVYVVDSETQRVTFASEAACRNLGYELDELQTMTPTDIAPELGSAGGFAEFVSRLESDVEAPSVIETTNRREDGTTYPVEVRVERVDSDEGTSYLVMSSDITARRKAQEALAESEERFRLMAENLPGAVYLSRDTDVWDMVYLNQGMYALTGYPRSDFLSGRRAYSSLCHSDDLPRMREEVVEACSEGRAFHLVYRITDARGATRWVEEFGEPLESTSGETLVEGVIFDITGRVLAERELATYREKLEMLVDERTSELDKTNKELDATIEELQSTNEELDATNEELQATNEELETAYERIVDVNKELERADTTKNRFLASMSHELRTPLNSIIGFSGILLGGMVGELDPEQARQIEMIQRSGKHLMMLVNDILDLEKIEAGAVELKLNAVDLVSMVDSAAEVIGPAAVEKDLELVIDMPSVPLDITTDEDRVRQILLNLLSNAVKYTDAGKIGVTLARKNGQVSVTIEDTGRGISADRVEDIFDEFRTIGRPTDTPQQGTGLGLAISRRLARMLGGDVTVSSVLGEGSRFTLTLPVSGPHTR